MTLMEISDRKNANRNLRPLLISVYLRNLRRVLLSFLPHLLPPFSAFQRFWFFLISVISVDQR